MPNIAVILAGGKGTRLGPPHRFLPKPLINIGLEPAINHVVDKFLQLQFQDGGGVEAVLVLIPEKQDLENASFVNADEEVTGGGGEPAPPSQMNLKDHFNRWREAFYSRASVQIEIEDPAGGSTGKGSTPIGGLAGLIKRIRDDGLRVKDGNPRQEMQDQDIVFISAGDNLFEDEFDEFARECELYPECVVNCYHDFHDPDRVRGRYGAVELDDDYVVRYEEKPAAPRTDQTKASAALYGFRWRHLLDFVEAYEQP